MGKKEMNGSAFKWALGILSTAFVAFAGGTLTWAWGHSEQGAHGRADERIRTLEQGFEKMDRKMDVIAREFIEAKVRMDLILKREERK